MTDYYHGKVGDNPERPWMVCRQDGEPITYGPEFRSAAAARRYCWIHFGAVSQLYIEGVRPFDPSIPLHRAIAKIESINTGWLVHSVGTHHYTAKRTAKSTEFAVKYEIKEGMVHARGDSEPV